MKDALLAKGLTPKEALSIKTGANILSSHIHSSKEKGAKDTKIDQTLSSETCIDLEDKELIECVEVYQRKIKELGERRQIYSRIKKEKKARAKENLKEEKI